MKAMSQNIRVLGSKVKRGIIKEAIHTFRTDILLLQGTKVSTVSHSIIRELWGNSQCSQISIDAAGTSGGILLCRNNKMYTIKDHFNGAFSVPKVLEDRANGLVWIVSSIYGPTDRRLRLNFCVSLTVSVADGLVLGAQVATRTLPDSPQRNLEVGTLQRTYKLSRIGLTPIASWIFNWEGLTTRGPTIKVLQCYHVLTGSWSPAIGLICSLKPAKLLSPSPLLTTVPLFSTPKTKNGVPLLFVSS